jgi:hypothetical protein
MVNVICPLSCQAGTKGLYRYSSTHTTPRRWNGVGGQRYAPAALPPGKRLRTHVWFVPDTRRIGEWVAPHRRSNPGCPARSKSLDRLCHPKIVYVCVWQYVVHVLAWSVQLTMVRTPCMTCSLICSVSTIVIHLVRTKQDALSLKQIHLSTKVSLKNLHPITQNLSLLTRPATHT